MGVKEIMGVLTLQQNTLEQKGKISVVIPLQWMHNVLNDPILGRAEILSDILTMLSDEDLITTIDWADYGIAGVSSGTIAAPAAANMNAKQLTDYITFMVDVIWQSLKLLPITIEQVKESFLKNVPYKVLTGWDLGVGISNWTGLIQLLRKYPEISKIRVETEEDDMLLLLGGAIDREKSLRVHNVDGWHQKKSYYSGTSHDDFQTFISSVSVWPNALYELETERPFRAAINKVIL
jgi:hypothetical protein